MVTTHKPGDVSDTQKLADLIQDARVAMFTTFTPQGPHARPMYTHNVKDFDGTLWFMTTTNSPKVLELQTDQNVLVTYADVGKNTYVSVRGTANAEKNPDKAKELWNIHAKGWYPGGPDDPNLVLIRVTVHDAEYWEGPSSTSYMLKLLKAVATNSRIDLDLSGEEHGKVRIA